jgi:uncharacterized protein YodC (DUF2158 family)
VPAAPNAFAIMAAAQAAQVPLEATLFLEARSDGSWACHWWSEGEVAQVSTEHLYDALVQARQQRRMHCAQQPRLDWANITHKPRARPIFCNHRKCRNQSSNLEAHSDGCWACHWWSEGVLQQLQFETELHERHAVKECRHVSVHMHNYPTVAA